MKAGQLEIEIVAQVAKLRQDMREIERTVGKATGTIVSQAKAANDNLRSIGKGAGAGLQQYSRDVARLKASLDPAWASLQKYKEEVFLLSGALRQGAITQQQYTQGLMASRTAYQQAIAGSRAVTGASNAQRMGMNQLAMQLGDVSTMYALGARPAQIFASQIGQVTQAVQLMTGGASRLAKFMSGPWGIAIIVAVQVLGPLVSKLFEAKEAADAAKLGADGLSEAQGALGEMFDLTSGKLQKQNDLLRLNAQLTAMNLRAEAMAAKASSESTFGNFAQGSLGLSLGQKVLGGLGIPVYGSTGREMGVRDLLRQFDAGKLTPQQVVKKAEGLDFSGLAVTRTEFVQAFAQQLEADAKTATANAIEKSLRDNSLDPSLRKPDTSKPDKAKTDRRAEALLREAEATDALIRGLNGLADAYLESEAAAMKAEIAAKATEQGIKKQADVAEYVERQMRLAVAQRTADAAKDVAALRAQNEAQAKLNERISQGGMLYEDAAQLMKDEAELRPYLAARAMAEGDAKQKLADIIAKLRGEQERSNRELALTKALQDASNYEKQVVEPLRREAQVLELVGWTRDKALLQMEREAELKPLLTRLTEALAKGETELAAAIQKQINLINERYGLEIQTGDRVESNRRAQESLDLYNDSLRETISLLQRLGGFGDVLGSLIGLASGNTASLSGPIGDLLNIRTGERFDEKSQRTVAVTIGDEMRKIFKLDGEFGKTMTGLLQGAGTGVMAANSIFGRQSSTEQLGSALGGAAGKVAGDALGKAIGGTLGSIAGAFAPVIGGLLGSLVGGLFTKTKWGRVDLSASGVSGAAGNDSASQRAAVKGGGSFMDALQQVADAFGGSIGDFGNISLGVRHGDWRVNTGGTSLKIKKGATEFDDDAEAAIAYAIQVAIERGAITGIRASTQNLLRASGDLQAKLDKALRFENVFKELASLQDPVAFALDELTRQFEQLRDIFAEAGATAEEYAQLEELLQLKRADAIEQARRDALSKLSEQRDLEIRILELLGRTEDALAASREMELESLKESLRPLQSMIYGLEDARAIMEQFEPLAADLKAFKQELLSTQGRDTFSAIAARFSQTAALAKNGDVQALAQLRGTASEFLEAAKANAASQLDYRRAVGQVLGAVDDGIFAADTQIEYAQMQIDAIAAQTDILASIRDKLDAANTVIADNTAKTVALLQRFEGDGLRVKTDEDTPLQVEVL